MSVALSQPLSPVTLVSPSGLKNKVAMMIEMKVMHGVNNTDFHSLRFTWL